MAPGAPRQYTCSAYRSVGVHGPYAAGPDRTGATFRFQPCQAPSRAVSRAKSAKSFGSRPSTRFTPSAVAAL